MTKTDIKTFCIFLIIVYAIIALSNLPSFIEAKKVDSNVTFSEFKESFNVVDKSWTEKQVINKFGEPDKLEIKNDIRVITYEWHDCEFTVLLEGSICSGGGINFHFKNDKLIGIGGSGNQ